MRRNNYYQPKKNSYNDKRRHWFSYVGEDKLGLVSGQKVSYKCLSEATGILHESLRTRVRDENIGNPDVSSWVITEFTLRPVQAKPFALDKGERSANKRDMARALLINRCETAGETLSNAWLRRKL